MPVHALEPRSYPQKATTTAADAILIQDAADTNNPKFSTIAGLAGIPAANIVVTPAGNLAAADVAAALNEHQTDIDTLSAINAANFFAGSADPLAADGENGDYWLNVVSGATFGPKAGGAWAATIGNAYDQLGLSAVAGAAPAAAGAVGIAAVAARADHVHPFQDATSTAVTASGNLAATNTQAALDELQGDIDTINSAAAPDLQNVTDTGSVTTNDVEITDGAKGLIMRDGTNARWRFTVNVNGALVSTAA